MYYNLNTDFIKSSDKAGHKSTYARTKFDATAATMLDEKGEIISGSDFPNGSLIVNEMSNDNATTIKYAIMFKDPSNPYADNNGWVWSYVNADNTIIEPSTRHGISCVGCHSNGIK